MAMEVGGGDGNWKHENMETQWHKQLHNKFNNHMMQETTTTSPNPTSHTFHPQPCP